MAVENRRERPGCSNVASDVDEALRRLVEVAGRWLEGRDERELRRALHRVRRLLDGVV
jgi:predicted RNase H-like HicB family nuclease